MNLQANFGLKRLLIAVSLSLVILGAQIVPISQSKATASNTKTYNPSALHIKFDEKAQVSLKGKEFNSDSGTDLSAINSVLSDDSVGAKSRLFSDTPDNIKARRQLIKSKTGKEVPDLNSYYRIQLKSGQDSAKLSKQLKSVRGIVEAYPEPVIAPPPVTPNFTSQQKYLTSSPAGMGITAGSTFPGAKGNNVRIADIEYSWNTSHEDISKSRAAGAQLNNGTPVDLSYYADHGTAVTGLISGDANPYGVTGIVPNASLKLVNSVSEEQGLNIANAVYVAQANLSPGDVILVEQQVGGPVQGTYVPAEWTPATYDAIKMATDSGIIVVEAAANSGLNLDDPIYGASFPQGKPDSGAIIVGAGAACGVDPSRSRLSFSNHGSRVNVQSYGECVATTGYGDLFSGTSANSFYTSNFSGTSSASALIAGVASSVSSSYEQINGISPSPAVVKDLLYRSGLSQNTTVNPGNIGPLPDLIVAQKLSDTTKPTMPASLTSSLNSKNKVVLKWSPATDNAGITNYKIYRNGIYVGSTTSLSFTDTTVVRSKSYSYQVVALDNAGNVSAFSNTTTIRTR